MSKKISLCGIKLGDTFHENNFKILNKQLIPGADYMCTIAHYPFKTKMLSSSSYFKNVNLVYSIGNKEISMIIADNGGGYSRKDCLDTIYQLNDYYLEIYGKSYDMYVEEDEKALWYNYYFYPPNYNVISFNDPKSTELKEPITTLMLIATKENFEEYFTLEAMLFHYEESDDDKSPEEQDDAKKKGYLKAIGSS